MSFYKKTIKDVPLDHKTVLVRADYNVPLAKDGAIADDYRITSSLPTLHYLIEHGCKIVIISHLGRPEGRDASCSLEVVASRLSELLDKEVTFIDDCKGDKVRMGVKKAPAGAIILLENLRYYAEEEANDLEFAKSIATDSGASYFVQDGFGVVHRAHASTDAMTQYLPSVAGLLIEKEYTMLESAIKNPKRPLVSIFGGAKVSDKIEIIQKLVPISDTILIGGAMANTFLAAKGYSMGKSKYEPEEKGTVDQILAQAEEKVGADKVGDYLMLPKDLAVTREIDTAAKRRTVPVQAVAEDEIALDIGDATIDRYAEALKGAGTVIWNGTMGYAELEQFSHGSARIALALASQPDTVTVVGGGDTADFVLHWDGQKGGSFTHVSTGGGASLELLSGKKLPGVESLLDAK